MGKPYRECPHCGAHLDAGERCDCGEPEQRKESGGGLKCAICGKPVERVKPCGYERWHGQVTCDECCEECYRTEPFPCRDHDERMKEKSEG